MYYIISGGLFYSLTHARALPRDDREGGSAMARQARCAMLARNRVLAPLDFLVALLPAEQVAALSDAVQPQAARARTADTDSKESSASGGMLEIDIALASEALQAVLTRDEYPLRKRLVQMDDFKEAIEENGFGRDIEELHCGCVLTVVSSMLEALLCLDARY